MIDIGTKIVHEFKNGLEHLAGGPCRERLSLSSFLSILTHKRLLLLAFLRFSYYPLDFCTMFKSTLRGLPKLITLEFPNRFKNQFQNSILYMIESHLELQLQGPSTLTVFFIWLLEH